MLACRSLHSLLKFSMILSKSQPADSWKFDREGRNKLSVSIASKYFYTTNKKIFEWFWKIFVTLIVIKISWGSKTYEIELSMESTMFKQANHREADIGLEDLANDQRILLQKIYIQLFSRWGHMEFGRLKRRMTTSSGLYKVSETSFWPVTS